MASTLQGKTEERLEQAVSNVHDVLVIASEHNLQAEVLATAMIYLKENPNASISRALSAGLDDWDI